ncbi:unnamed protein product (macronuclear) [Paramecium tetraurelia]|uniref:Chromosome undetermined scaffold_1, whole genome shotgun sequence n=1 Tax=Paramecium tetraurelia TaxID=5888 RepID=Q6BG58_PARTE|nr:hypothetical protein [Paramecium tetraurelia strain d4-2]XP_001423327.1 uncharacterized protein GSPATT00000364001 [Paramecium tetraurelia]CAH03362.1 hypothetical protein PTMB.165c [Paramecium tetraurelia]CAK55929.1 unnamed protein product [Paramecium tetraurelia]|eukprot:XP_001423327.1 hypothetical protein (macronuclear) [Paramecium tetraurelia strain d4-2]
MISNDNKGQILWDIGGHLLNSFSKQGSSEYSINRKDIENYIEIKKVVEGQSYKYYGYQSSTLQTFTNFRQTNLNKTEMKNCECNNEDFTKMSVKQMHKSKENLEQNQYQTTQNFRSRSTSTQLISQNYQKSQNINIQTIKNYEDEKIKNIAEGLKSKIQSNLNNKLKHYFIKNSKQITSKILPNQDLQMNDQKQLYFHNSSLSLKEYFQQKSIEFKQKFLEEQSQIIEEKLQTLSNKAKTIETTKKSLSRSYDIPMHTPKKQLYKMNRESESKLGIKNDSYQTKLLNSLNLIPKRIDSNNDNHYENQTKIQTENNLENNFDYSQTKKFVEYNFNEMKNQNQSNNHMSISFPKCPSSQSQNKLMPHDEKNSPIEFSSKVNRYMNLLQSFKSFNLNQTQLNKDIEVFDSIQVNDLNHISEFSIFKDEKQKDSQNFGVYSEIDCKRSFSNVQTNKKLFFESAQVYQQNNKTDLKQDHFINGINKVHIEQTQSQNDDYASSNIPKNMLQKQGTNWQLIKIGSFKYNQQLNY